MLVKGFHRAAKYLARYANRGTAAAGVLPH
jgi:hypothetical protein